MIEWFEKEACDGFMLMSPTYPNAFEKFIDLVIPVLQARGVFRKEYESHMLKDLSELYGVNFEILVNGQGDLEYICDKDYTLKPMNLLLKNVG